MDRKPFANLLTPPGKPRYEALLLDMNGTFMFEHDRFDGPEDLFLTYQGLGGSRLDVVAVEQAVRSIYEWMLGIYTSPSRIDDFPSLAEAVRSLAGVPETDLDILEQVFAAHEMGRIPETFAECLRRLGSSYRLGIVSNIWARKEPWLRHFEEMGVADLWRTSVFSSDTRSIKPSPVLFRTAIAELGLAPAHILFVGDNLRADILPAKALGMGTAWVGAAAGRHEAADWTAPSLLELEEALR
jgi:beta-phosphoglucomutase-like phosphatase (HAD superfamily)